MQRPISVNAWDTESSLLYRQHFEVNEEPDRGQEVESTASTNGFGDAADGLTVGELRPPTTLNRFYPLRGLEYDGDSDKRSR